MFSFLFQSLATPSPSLTDPSGIKIFSPPNTYSNRSTPLSSRQWLHSTPSGPHVDIQVELQESKVYSYIITSSYSHLAARP